MLISHRREKAEQMSPRALPAHPHADEVVTASGVTFQLWRLYQHAWLACLCFPLISIVREPFSPWQVILRGLALGGFAAGYTWLMWPHPVDRQTVEPARRRYLCWLLFGMLGILVVSLSLVYGPAWLWLLIGVSALTGLLFPMRSAFALIVLLTLFPLWLALQTRHGPGGVDWWWLIALMLLVRGLGLDMIGVARLGSALRELHTTRRELARLAVIEERERLARDLHDLLGQSLSMMVLKSELARSLIAEDPTGCAQELAEIEEVGRRTLREMRKTVAGYRQPRLASEVDGARQLLTAAGIAFAIEPLPGELPPPFDAVLAWTVREGITNVIRHSGARRCLLRFTREPGWIGIELLNDGVQAEDARTQLSGQGSGLPGLRERVSGLGGTLEAGPWLLTGKPHFRLHVALPMQSPVEASA